MIVAYFLKTKIMGFSFPFCPMCYINFLKMFKHEYGHTKLTNIKLGQKNDWPPDAGNTVLQYIVGK
jgi:hypothetical protein